MRFRALGSAPESSQRTSSRGTGRAFSAFGAGWTLCIFLGALIGAAWLGVDTWAQASGDAVNAAATVGETPVEPERVTPDATSGTEAEAAEADEDNNENGDEAKPNPAEWVIGKMTDGIFAVLFFDVFFGAAPAELPFVVMLLGAGAVFFTLYHGFINLRGFKHSVDVVRGKFSDPTDSGDITPFRALTSALSATVGLGNIAGVAIAVKTGGPGAVFWMMFLGLFGMTAKFHESTLGQLFRTQNADGTVSGGAMYYLSRGLEERGLKPLGKILAVIFAVFCIGGALGGGNMFQANQSFDGFFSTFVSPTSQTIAERHRDSIDPELLRSELTPNQLMLLMEDEATREAAAETINSVQVASLEGDELAAAIEPALAATRAAIDPETIRRIALPGQIETLLPQAEVEQAKADRKALRTRTSWGYGLVLSVLVGIVVIGGITRVGAATSKIVPTMCGLYVLGCLTIILMNLNQLPSLVGEIFAGAFGGNAIAGGLIGVMVIGFTRAAFSSEAGLGSSAIAHSAAKQSEPVREGFVASLEPFIDTIVICFLTAMAVLITGAHIAPEMAEESNGAAVTLFAFEQVGPLSGWFPAVLTVSIMLFAFSTMISWCYYGERSWIYLFGDKTLLIFRLIFVACVLVGSTQSLGVVLDFSDAMLLSMALPNIVGGVLLAPLVKRELSGYWAKLKSGQMKSGPKADPGSDI